MRYEDRGLHHDFLKMPNGNMLLLSSAAKPASKPSRRAPILNSFTKTALNTIT